MHANPQAAILLIAGELPDLPAWFAAAHQACAVDFIEVCTASSAREALQLISQIHLTAIVIDADSAPLGGLALAAQIRTRPHSRNCPILFVTDASLAGFPVDKVVALGAVDFLSRPVHPAVLRAKLAMYLEWQRKIAETANLSRTIVLRSIARAKREQESLLLQAANARMADMFKHAPAFMCTFRGPDHVVEMVNDRYLQLVGNRDLIGKPVRQALPEIDGQGFVELLDAVYATGEPFLGVDIAFQLQRLPGSRLEQRFLDVVYSALRDADGAISGVLGHGVDQTERRLAEEELRALAAALSEADRRKTEFLATLAHELRNPLAPIRNGLTVMRLGADNPALMAKTRDIMDRQVSQMVRLIDDLLDVARISGGKMDLRQERIDLNAVLAGAIETSMSMIDAGGHVLQLVTAPHSLPVHADAARMAQVIGNLLNNAAKYTRTGGLIRVETRRDGDQAVLSVSDNGVGIPAESLAAVFDLFNQVRRNMDLAQGGLGIGLSLVRRIMEMHGGSVAADSAGAGCGASFTLRLPLLLAGMDAQPVTAGRGAGAVRECFKILVVDDNVDAADTLCAILQLDGHDTRSAHDGRAALVVAAGFRPDIAFLDIGMPGMNGYEVAQALRAAPDLRDMELVALTGWGTEADRTRAAQAGFNQHLTKPAELASVTALLERLGRTRALAVLLAPVALPAD